MFWVSRLKMFWIGFKDQHIFWGQSFVQTDLISISGFENKYQIIFLSTTFTIIFRFITCNFMRFWDILFIDETLKTHFS